MARRRLEELASCVFDPAVDKAGLGHVRPYDLRHSFVSLLIVEGRSIVDVGRQAGNSATVALDTYGHFVDELEGTERISAEEAIREARADLVRTAPVSVVSKKTKPCDLKGLFRSPLTDSKRRPLLPLEVLYRVS